MSSTIPNCKRPFVDFKLQRAVALRIVAYWLTCQFTIAVHLYCSKIVTNGEQPTDFTGLFFRCALWVTLAFLLVAVSDVVREANRFARPILQLKKATHNLNSGMHLEAIQCQDGDAWQEMIQDFSVLLNRVQRRDDTPEHEVRLDRTSDATLQLSGMGSH